MNWTPEAPALPSGERWLLYDPEIGRAVRIDREGKRHYTVRADPFTVNLESGHGKVVSCTADCVATAVLQDPPGEDLIGWQCHPALGWRCRNHAWKANA